MKVEDNGDGTATVTTEDGDVLSNGAFYNGEPFTQIVTVKREADPSNVLDVVVDPPGRFFGHTTAPRARVTTGHDARTPAGQEALAKLLVYGANQGAIGDHIREVMRRHETSGPRKSPGGIPLTGEVCQRCGEPWECSTWRLADALEAVVQVIGLLTGERK